MTMSLFDGAETPGASETSRLRPHPPGVTLVELLVVSALALIVSGVAFSIYHVNTVHYLRQEAYIQQQQNLRAAMFVMSRDLRMAGTGLLLLGPAVKRIQAWTPSRPVIGPDSRVVIEPTSGWFSLPGPGAEPGARAVFGIDGGELGSDVVTVFRAEMEFPSSLGRVSGLSGATLTLSSDAIDGALAAGDIIGLVKGEEAVLMEVEKVDGDEVEIKCGGRLTGPSLAPVGFEIMGASVYNLRDVSLATYYVDESQNQLMVAHHDQARDGFDAVDIRSTVVASNIEDLQIHYYFGGDEVDPQALSDGPDISHLRLEADSVKVVALGMVSRSGYGEGIARWIRPSLYNRLDGIDTDNRRRAILSEYIYLRNFSQ